MGEDSRVPPPSPRVPAAADGREAAALVIPPVLPESLLQRLHAATDAADAVTTPIPAISGSADGDIASPAAGGTGARPDQAAQAAADHGPAAAMRVTAQRRPGQRRPGPQATGPEVPGPKVLAGRRYRKAGAVVSVIVLIAAVSLAFALSRHTPAAAARAGATRGMAADWVAGQVSRAAMVSCDPVMCRALEAHGIPAAGLLVLKPGTANPLRSDVVVATAAVRGMFGGRLSSVYAPEVIASFGSGNLRIEVRAIAPHGAAAYFAALRADLRARKASGAQLLRSDRIAVSAGARRQLSAGQVDARLLITIAGLASLHPVHVVAFGDAGPGIGASSPLRSADLSATGGAPGASGYLRSMLAFLRAQRAPYVAAHAGTARLADGQTVLRGEFAAPSPLGLLGPA